ncbi:hypothetical protein PR048_016762 [Dryococelus australis]|uniref:Uncharacterized protein n=1 Tax=Dryococelus australis TaxID=614101 RepID=A0ABQ9H7T9_9NEOP|nr:hypothetical protein PR048_016762 [Dryococelus australis]
MRFDRKFLPTKTLSSVGYGLISEHVPGMRFGLMQAKVCLAALLSRYLFEPCSKTPIPLVLDNKSVFTTAKGGIWLQVKGREETTLSEF